ncbi:MAG: radical SAM protein, partial [Phycisphaerae bacterium]|nr:radical SAM protein [Phycisphaerae bacterium]
MNVSLPMIIDAPPSSPVQSKNSLFDSHGRQIHDLRLSVTDRCNFRCVYCMEPDVKYMPKQQLLSLDEYIKIVEIAMSLGITKLRITGGEPTLYPKLLELITAVSAMGIVDLALTTNGSTLNRTMAEQWKNAGL